jgi:hypothetical protein
MRHALVYHGAFELNFDRLVPGGTLYLSTAGTARPLALRPEGVDGLIVYYMEKTGKKFIAVRLRFEDFDVVLRSPVVIDPMRHMGNRRFSARPVEIQDEFASALLDDIISLNPEQEEELALLLNRVNHVRRGDRDTIE